MSDYSYQSEINNINPIACQYNRLIRRNNLALSKYEELKSKPATRRNQTKQEKLLVKLSKIQQKLDSLGYLIESEYG